MLSVFGSKKRNRWTLKILNFIPKKIVSHRQSAHCSTKCYIAIIFLTVQTSSATVFGIADTLYGSIISAKTVPWHVPFHHEQNEHASFLSPTRLFTGIGKAAVITKFIIEGMTA